MAFPTAAFPGHVTHTTQHEGHHAGHIMRELVRGCMVHRWAPHQLDQSLLESRGPFSNSCHLHLGFHIYNHLEPSFGFRAVTIFPRLSDLLWETPAVNLCI